jgi:hypothetical protein
VGAGLALRFLDTGERLHQVSELLWATAPVIGLGLAAVGVVLIGPEVRSAYRWFKARTPANKFRADGHRFERLLRRWSIFEEHNPLRVAPKENRLLLIEDTKVLLKRHGIPAPEGSDPDELWTMLMLVTLAASKEGNLRRARAQPNWLKEKLLPGSAENA